MSTVDGRNHALPGMLLKPTYQVVECIFVVPSVGASPSCPVYL